MTTPELIAGRYRVERLLGQGGMGVVYAVHDSATGEKLALKRLLSGATERMRRLFELEYQTLSSLCHPGIVQVFDYQRDPEGAFYTMELVQGRDLGEQAPMPWRHACACMRDVASILALLHARRLLHRDLTPRNLLRTESGRLKLIDFGTLAAFGETDDVVGTLQFMAPEALGDEAIDQRADLFSLGALGYWLLTGVHAFPARNLSELEQSWQHPPAPPSSLIALLNDAAFEPPPSELDDLIANLLQIDPAQRPQSTAELIDRLTALADLDPEHELSAEGYLNSKAFVGRVQERERVRGALLAAGRGVGRAILIEGASGMGHTRFLREIGVISRLSGALVASGDASAGTRSYGAALSLLTPLLPSLPDDVFEAEPLQILGRLSRELHARMGGGSLPPLPGSPSEARVRYQNALHALFLRASKRRVLILLLDDLHEMDEESQALFAALAVNADEHALVLVASARQLTSEERSPALSSYRQLALRMRLPPLNATETLELLRSLFGTVPYLERVAERLQRISEGNPGHCLELASQLVRSGLARYREGMWALPAALSDEDLPRDPKLARRARLERLSPEAHQLAALLSVQSRDVLSFEHCVRLAALADTRQEPRGAREAVARTLEQLVREGLLRQSAHGHRFAHEEEAQSLYAELSPSQRTRAHRALGELLLVEAGEDPVGRLRACPHFLRAGDRAQGLRLAIALAGSLAHDYGAMVRAAAPLHEEVLTLLKAQGEDDYTLLEPLCVLSAAGYYVDHRLATRYGEEAAAVVERVLRIGLARRLSRWIGAKLALWIALALAAVALFVRRSRAPSLPIAIQRGIAAASALAGTAASCLDARRTSRYAELIAPFAAFGPDHACGIAYEFGQALCKQVQDRPAAARRSLTALIARLESDRPIRELPADLHRAYLAGSYLALGINESLREGPEVLAIADKLQDFGPLFVMSADYLRATHHAGQGAHQQFEHYRLRAEVHAVHLGSAWQIDTWAPADATKLGLRAFDVLIMKQAAQQLARFSRQIPSLEAEEGRARGTYLALRGKHREALALLDVEEEPLSTFGWARTRGTLAMVYNALGDHARALAVCEDALSWLEPDDLQYTVLNLGVQIESALAKLGLGDAAQARRELDALIALHAPKQGPLTLGLLHRARFRVALREHDFTTATEQLTKLEGWYRSTGMPSLIEVAHNLRRELQRAQSPHAGEPGSAPNEVRDASHVFSRAELMLKRDVAPDRESRARRALSVAREMMGAQDGFVLFAHGAARVVQLELAPSTDLLAWAERELASANDHDAELRTEEIDSALDPYKLSGGLRYFGATLRSGQADGQTVLALLVLGFAGAPRMPDRGLLALVAAHIDEGERQAKRA